MPEDVLKVKSYAFALRIVKLSQFLVSEHKEYVISRQVLRSGTSIGANVAEAGHGESKPDFIHKLSISQKEFFETHFWLRLLRDSGYISDVHASSMLSDCEELQKLLTASLKTAKASLKKYRR